MITLLEVPGTKKLEQADVDKFPVVRPVQGELVHVWDMMGSFKGTFRSRDSSNPGNGIQLVNVTTGVVIDSNCEPVHWMTVKKSINMVGGKSMKHMLNKPGSTARQQYDVRLFPNVRPAEGHTAYVWDLGGHFLGEYLFHFGKTAADDFIKNVREDHVISADDGQAVYWQHVSELQGPIAEKAGPAPDVPDLVLRLSISTNGLNVVCAEEIISADDVNPGDKIEMFEQWWNVRYINFYTGSRRFQLQREEDELHPLCDKTCMKVEFHDGLHVRIKRMLPARGGRDA